jgi:hypothetical protein
VCEFVHDECHFGSASPDLEYWPAVRVHSNRWPLPRPQSKNRDPSTDKLLYEHFGQKRGGDRVLDEDRPRRMLQHTYQLLWRARKPGVNIDTDCDAIGCDAIVSRGNPGTLH